MANYVLVHGAWHGGWAWTPVARLLSAQGHTVHTPTMAGHGPDVDRVGVGQAECVNSLVRYIEERNLRDITLVGHSWGGNVLCGAAPLIANRLSGLIFWNAFVVGDGESLVDVVPQQFRELFTFLAGQTTDNTVMLPWEVWRAAFMQTGSEGEARLAYELMTPEPFGCFTDKLDQKAFFALDTPRSYINCRDDIALPPGEYAWYPRFGQRLGEHKLVEAEGCHEACFTNTAQLAAAILEATPA